MTLIILRTNEVPDRVFRYDAVEMSVFLDDETGGGPKRRAPGPGRNGREPAFADVSSHRLVYASLLIKAPISRQGAQSHRRGALTGEPSALKLYSN